MERIHHKDPKDYTKNSKIRAAWQLPDRLLKAARRVSLAGASELQFLMMKIKLFSLLLFFISFAALAQHPPQERKLIFAVDIIRHGDRTPIIEIPTAPHHWSEGLGQLTPLGMHQEYELGKKFHQRYIGKLLPRTYHSGTLYVRSTDLDRTLMSAQCVLMGLYPPGSGPFLYAAFLMNWFSLPFGIQPIPIHTVPQDQDTLLISHHTREKIKQSTANISEYNEQEEKLKCYFPAWSHATGVPIHNAIDLERLGDALYIYKLKYIPIPKELSKEDANMIIETSRFVFKKSIFSDKQTGKNLLAEISHYLKQAADKKTSLKYILYSAHDSTIMSLLAALNVPIKEIPHYSSDLNIALYESSDHHFSVEVILNDHPVEFEHSSHGSCSLQEFLALVK